tara:strand:- start:165 stop:278 length:114 start_codon:yes stop_codon:yes gene_type:complete
MFYRKLADLQWFFDYNQLKNTEILDIFGVCKQIYELL